MGIQLRFGRKDCFFTTMNFMAKNPSMEGRLVREMHTNLLNESFLWHRILEKLKLNRA